MIHFSVLPSKSESERIHSGGPRIYFAQSSGFDFVIYILYTVANSNAMNGWSSADRLKVITPWWKTALYALDTVLAVLTVLCIWRLVVAIKRKKTWTAEQAANTAYAQNQQ